MKLFKCSFCGQLLYFENSLCENCKHALGFIPEEVNLFTLNTDTNGFYTVNNDKKQLPSYFTGNNKPQYKYCLNHQYDVCNWLIPAAENRPFCRACELNHIVPNLTNPQHLTQWRAIEAAKHRLIYTLLQLKLPLVSKIQDPEKGLSFNFLSDNGPGGKVLTGHENGLITLNVEEADDDKRELYRKQMHEPYRTLLGHFRHEVGHYYWDLLIAGSAFLEDYRKLFGDEREDYDQALQRHYRNGAPANWNLNYISEYASSHPWEDWAETWAHYLHIIDTLETAAAFGLKVDPPIVGDNGNLKAAVNTNPFGGQNFQELLDLWLPLTYAMNSINRSMGNHDLYPFVIQNKVIEKLSFIHRVCAASKVNEQVFA